MSMAFFNMTCSELGRVGFMTGCEDVSCSQPNPPPHSLSLVQPNPFNLPNRGCWSGLALIESVWLAFAHPDLYDQVSNSTNPRLESSKPLEGLKELTGFCV